MVLEIGSKPIERVPIRQWRSSFSVVQSHGHELDEDIAVGVAPYDLQNVVDRVKRWFQDQMVKKRKGYDCVRSKAFRRMDRSQRDSGNHYVENRGLNLLCLRDNAVV